MANHTAANHRRKTHYEVLQISSTATESEIKHAYFQAVRQYHPDKQKNEEQGNDLFLALQAAWECLRDSEKRRVYNEALYLTESHSRSRAANAILMDPNDCTTPETVLDDETDQLIRVCFFTCRCGEQLDIVINDEEEDSVVDCPGCCLLYVTQAVRIRFRTIGEEPSYIERTT